MPKVARRLAQDRAPPKRSTVPSSVRRGQHRPARQGQKRTAAPHGFVEIESATPSVPAKGHEPAAGSISPVDAGEASGGLPDKGRDNDASPASPVEIGPAVDRLPDQGHRPDAGSISPDDLRDLITQVKEWQVRRKHHIRVATKITNGIGALVRRNLGWAQDNPDAGAIKEKAVKIVDAFMDGKEMTGPNLKPGLVKDLEVARLQLGISWEAERKIALEMRKAARKLPGYAFVKAVRGFGDLGFAVLVGEAGDLAAYAPGPRCPKKAEKLWRRLGLAPYEGHALSTWRRKGGLSAEEWTHLGYSPRRRAEIYAVIEDPLFRHQSVSEGPYHSVYLMRREHTALTHPDWSKAESHGDAKRVMLKALISDLWSEWRRAKRAVPEKAIVDVPAANIDPREGREQASEAMPEKARLDVPAPKKSPTRGRRQASIPMPDRANETLPDANTLPDEGREQATTPLPEKATGGLPAPKKSSVKGRGAGQCGTAR